MRYSWTLTVACNQKKKQQKFENELLTYNIDIVVGLRPYAKPIMAKKENSVLYTGCKGAKCLIFFVAVPQAVQAGCINYREFRYCFASHYERFKEFA